MSEPITLIRARWVAPIDRPIIENGAVAIAGDRIVDVGEYESVRQSHAPARTVDAGDALITPGLVNAHTHLELSGVTCGEAPASFTDWILSLPQRLGRDGLTPEQIFPAATRAGTEQCLRFGVTCIGDISQQMHLTRPILRESPLRAVSYGEVLGLAKRSWRFAELLPLAIDQTLAGQRLTIGLSPHAPYTVDIDRYRHCVAIARSHGLPIATHLAETADESEFLATHGGPFRDVYETLGAWSDDVPRFQGGPIRFAEAVWLLRYPALLAHVNYCDDDELEILSRGEASVVYCPRTHRHFGHPPHRWREMLARGINVALGTDSCATSPDLNLLDDARLAHGIAPEVPVETIWEMITLRGARAIQQDAQIGSLMPGKAADLAVFPVASDDPLREILESQTLPSALWIAGQPVRGQG